MCSAAGFQLVTVPSNAVAMSASRSSPTLASAVPDPASRNRPRSSSPEVCTDGPPSRSIRSVLIILATVDIPFMRDQCPVLVWYFFDKGYTQCDLSQLLSRWESAEQE